MVYQVVLRKLICFAKNKYLHISISLPPSDLVTVHVFL